MDLLVSTSLLFKNTYNDNNDVDPKPDKDDQTTPSKIVFGTLAFFTTILLVFCCYNWYLLLKTERCKRNIPLVLFKMFLLTTLIRKLNLIIG